MGIAMSGNQECNSVERIADNDAFKRGFADREAMNISCPYDAFAQREQYAAWLSGYQAANLQLTGTGAQ